MNTLKELYLKAARVAEMIEGTNLTMGECWKFDGFVIGDREPNFNCDPSLHSAHEACLAIVENKPVFHGDILFNDHGAQIPASFIYKNKHFMDFNDYHWSLPKPKTVMVEMLVEDAEFKAGIRCVLLPEVDNIKEREIQACCKALEGLKS